MNQPHGTATVIESDNPQIADISVFLPTYTGVPLYFWYSKNPVNSEYDLGQGFGLCLLIVMFLGYFFNILSLFL